MFGLCTTIILVLPSKQGEKEECAGHQSWMLLLSSIERLAR